MRLRFSRSEVQIETFGIFQLKGGSCIKRTNDGEINLDGGGTIMRKIAVDGVPNFVEPLVRLNGCCAVNAVVAGDVQQSGCLRATELGLCMLVCRR